jgi:hypothetical protein
MPKLTKTDFVCSGGLWVATTVLPAWQGFRNRRGPYGPPSTPSVSDGTAQVVFAPEGRDESPISEGEFELIDWAVRNAAEMLDSFLVGLLAEYRSLREDYAEFVEPGEMPIVESVECFKGLIGLHTLTVHPLSKDGLPYVGFILGCTWDREHGLGALMHGTRLVQIGGADTAILLWIAEDDAARIR